MSAATADVLDAAADLLERDGWCQGDWVDALGRRCASGALERFAPSGKTRDRVCDALVPWAGHSVTRWNDADGRTAEEVIATFRAAAEAQRAS